MSRAEWRCMSGRYRTVHNGRDMPEIVFNLKKCKTMKEIYLVVAHAVSNCEDCGVGTQIFSAYEDAHRAFDNYVSGEMAYIAEEEGWIVEQSEDSFCAYEDGRYSENHTFGEIRKVFVE